MDVKASSEWIIRTNDTTKGVQTLYSLNGWIWKGMADVLELIHLVLHHNISSCGDLVIQSCGTGKIIWFVCRCSAS